MRRWKFSPINLESITRWKEYSQAGDRVFVHTNIDITPWNAVELEDECKAWINAIHHPLDLIPYEHIECPALELPKRPGSNGYRRMDHVLPRRVSDYASALKASSGQKKYVDLEGEGILQGRISSI